jgi:hypothetical protein
MHDSSGAARIASAMFGSANLFPEIPSEPTLRVRPGPEKIADCARK